MINAPSVSVLMSFYNEKLEFLKLSIDSILTQSFTNFEFVIISDNPDNYVLNTFVRGIEDSRIIFIENKVNIGLTKALNKGLTFCRGKYIIRMDADDIALHDRIKDQVNFMDHHPEIFASGGFGVAINENGEIISKISVPTDFKLMPYYSLFLSPLLHPTVIIRRNNNIVKYDENFRYAQDYALWVSLMGEGLIISNMPKCILKYRYSENQIFKKHKIEQAQCADRILLNALANLGLHFSDSDVSYWKKINTSKLILNKEYACLKDFIIRFYEDNHDDLSKEGLDYVCNKLILNLIVKIERKNAIKLLREYFKLLSQTHCCFKIKLFIVLLINLMKRKK